MIGILLVSHGGFAEELKAVGRKILGPREAVEAIGIDYDDGPEEMLRRIREGLVSLGDVPEVLILADLYGGSCANICLALQAAQPVPVEIVCGMNLPSFLKAVLDRNKGDARSLAEKVAETGRRGLIRVKRSEAGGSGGD